MNVVSIVLAGVFALAAESQHDVDLFRSLDTNQDGTVTSEEVSGAQRTWFRRALRVSDLDGDGGLTPAELSHALSDPEPRSVASGARASGNRQRMLDPQRLDSNKDGMISIDEVPRVVRQRLRSALQRSGKKAFSIEEMARFVAHARKLNDQQSKPSAVGDTKRKPDRKMEPDPSRALRDGVAELFRNLDTNSDGKISGREARRAPRFVERFDRNDDGVVQRGELSRATQKTQNENPGRIRKEADTAADSPQGTITRRRKAGPQGGFARFDRNADNVITPNEAPLRMKGVFARIDADADGTISRREFVAYVRQRASGAKNPQ